MSWFQDDRRKQDRAAGMRRANELAALYEALVSAVRLAITNDPTVRIIVDGLAELDVRAEHTVTIDLVYAPQEAREARGGPRRSADGRGEPTEAPASATGQAVPLFDDADVARAAGMGVRLENEG